MGFTFDRPEIHFEVTRLRHHFSIQNALKSGPINIESAHFSTLERIINIE